MENYFTKLNSINVNEHTEEKNGLTYLSWAWAWAELLKIYPDATYTIERFGEDNKPYIYDETLGYMVFTKVKIGDLEKEMWLPVMDGANKAMKDKPYTYQVKKWNNTKRVYEYTEKSVEAATMFDVNKTIMRCLVKNLAMFGLGLYIYSGEDLPEESEDNKTIVETDYKAELEAFIAEKGLDKKNICTQYKLSSKSTQNDFKKVITELKLGTK